MSPARRSFPLFAATVAIFLALTPVPVRAQNGGAPGWTARPAPADEVPLPAREFRAAWVATVYNLDWPTKPGLPAEAQKAELSRLLDAATALRLNAIIFQIRPAADALYASSLEPWSAFLTGRQGGNPGYDPLAYALTEAHRRGIELHAWFNPFRARAGKTEVSADHFSLKHPEWMRVFNGQMWMDPGEPGVQRHVLEVVKDVLTRYDVDGVHIDDYFYPYPLFGSDGLKRDVPLGDETTTWKEYGQGMEIGDWRRQNINRFVRSLYTLTKATRPAARVGISPFGIWQPGVPEGIKAKVDATRHLYGDSRLWLQQGWCDYFTPQLYWRIRPTDQSFTTLLNWWTAQSRGRPVWPGISADRLSQGNSPDRPVAEIIDQISLVRQASSAPGEVMWRMKSLMANRNGIASLLKEKAWSSPALTPPAPWLGASVPGPPSAPRVIPASTGGGGFRLGWTGNVDRKARWTLVQVKSKKDGTWSTAGLCFRDRSEWPLDDRIIAVALRSVSETGILSPAVLVERR